MSILIVKDWSATFLTRWGLYLFNIDLFTYLNKHIGRLARMSVLDTEVDGSNLGSSMSIPWARHFIRIASVDSDMKLVPGWDNLVKDVQCYELFGGIALKNHAFSFSMYIVVILSDFIYANVSLC